VKPEILPSQSSAQRNYCATSIWLILAFVLAAPHPLHASLGGDTTSVQADQAHMQGTLSSVRAQNYMVHEIHAPTGTVIREYMSPSGTVFAVAWEGSWPPDMHQLLGDYFEQYTQAAQAQSNVRSGRRPLHIELPGLVVRLSGHPRSFAGKAYLPDKLPPGVSADELR
jgi:Protein of unknown function (DUF2844)